jgi:carbamate kinase
MPLDVLVAMTEGSLGYILQQNLLNHLRRKDVRRYVVTVVTQVLVDESDPAFKNPTKPIGPSSRRKKPSAAETSSAGSSRKTRGAGGAGSCRRPAPSRSSSAT